VRNGWLGTIRELARFVREERKYALAPLLVLLLLFGVFILLAEVPAVTPFIYSLF
jgi:hypothetical protein